MELEKYECKLNINNRPCSDPHNWEKENESCWRERYNKIDTYHKSTKIYGHTTTPKQLFSKNNKLELKIQEVTIWFPK